MKIVNYLKKCLFSLILLFTICGCSNVTYNYNVIPSINVSNNLTYSLVNSFDDLSQIKDFENSFYSKYQNDYFDSSCLLIIYFPGNSSMVEYKVKKINIKNEKLIIEINEITPRQITLDYVCKNMVIELNKNEIINYKSIDINVNKIYKFI